MHIHTSLSSLPSLQHCALSIGTFDGVHRGHQLLIEELKREAKTRDLRMGVLTFQDMPHCFFRPDQCPRLLTLPDEKIGAFEELGIDELFIVPFDASLAQQDYEAFTRQILVEKLRLNLLVVGPDFALGKNRAGDARSLSALGAQLGFDVRVLNKKLEDKGEAISSTRVRGCVESGEVETAARMLGRVFSIGGQVVSGKQLGRTIGVPTINLKTHARKVLPAKGIYSARALFPDASIHLAALSIGTNPTTDNSNDIKIEFHVIGETIETPPRAARLEIVSWLRGEQKFDSLDALLQQMQRDIEDARRILM